MPAAYDVRAYHDANYAQWLTNPDNLSTATPSNGNTIAGIPWVFVDFDGHTPAAPGFVGVTNSNYTLNQRRQVLEALDAAYSPFNVRFTTNPNAAPGAGYFGGTIIIGMDAINNPGAYLGQASQNSFGDTNWSQWPVHSMIQISQGINAPVSVNYTGMAAVHEIAHTLGLGHKGLNSPYQEYYGGHLTASGNHWSPIMGTLPPASPANAFFQWSKGDYRKNNRGASNTVDEVAHLNARLGTRPDDYSNFISTSLPNRTVGDGRFISGVISTRTDVDIFKIQWTGGPMSLRVDPVGSVVSPGTVVTHGNVDDVTGLNLSLEILNTNGVVVASASPTNSKSALITDFNLPLGTYFARVDGVGEGTFGTGANSTGFDDYGSLGGYVLGGAF
jgi:hypothetical protein